MPEAPDLAIRSTHSSGFSIIKWQSRWVEAGRQARRDWIIGGPIVKLGTKCLKERDIRDIERDIERYNVHTLHNIISHNIHSYPSITSMCSQSAP